MMTSPAIDILRNHGASCPRRFAPGDRSRTNCRTSNVRLQLSHVRLQAAVAAVQFEKLDQFIDERRKLADAYDAMLQGIPWVIAPTRPAHADHALQAYVIMVDETRAPASRNAILQRLQDRGIGGRPGTHSVVGLSVYRDRFGTDPADFPAATRAEQQSIALPLHNHMVEDDVARVVAELAGVARG